MKKQILINKRFVIGSQEQPDFVFLGGKCILEEFLQDCVGHFLLVFGDRKILTLRHLANSGMPDCRPCRGIHIRQLWPVSQLKKDGEHGKQ